jgi:hypothetical protein
LTEGRGSGLAVTVYSTASIHHTRLRQGVASPFAVGFASRGECSRVRDPGGDARVFRPCSRATAISRSVGPPVRESQGLRYSLRRWAGGASEGAASRARECRSRARHGSLRAVMPGSRSQSREVPRAWLRPSGSRLHAPSMDSMGSFVRPTCSAGLTLEGLALWLSPGSCPKGRLRASTRALTPGRPRRTACAFQRDFPSFRSLAAIRFQLSGTLLRGERHPVSSRPAAFHVARRCALVGPCGLPRSHRQGASNPLLQPTFAPRAPVANITFGDCPPGSAGNPPLSAFEIARERGVATLLRELCRTAFRSSGLQQPRA